MSSLEKSRESLREEFKKKDCIDNMRRGFERTIERIEETLSKEGELHRRYAKHVRDVRDEVIKNLDEDVKKTVSALKKSGFEVHGPFNATDAVEKVYELLDGEKFLVKSKSKVTKEIMLTEKLGGKGVEIVETDIGDRALQLYNRSRKGEGLPIEKPRHTSGPCIGFSRYDFAKVLEKAYGVKLEGLSPDELAMKEIALLREDVSKAVAKSKIGITGANAITMDGSVVLMHNEGNISKVSMVSQLDGSVTKHIIITSIEKILPTVQDAITKLNVESLYATGARPSYIEILTGKSKTADIERILFTGVYGPKEIHIVLVDDYRSKAAKSEFKEVLRCVSCGRCILNCPTYNCSGPAFGYKGYPGGIGTMFCALKSGAETATENGLFLCTTCGNCKVECPAEIETHELIPKLRANAVESRVVPETKKIVEVLEKNGNVYGEDNAKRLSNIRFKNSRDAEYLLFIGCNAAFKDNDTANTAIKLLDKIGVKYRILDDEGCCGEILKLVGELDAFKKLTNENRKAFEKTGLKKIITICPSCYDTLKKEFGDRYEVLHITEILAQNKDRFKLKKKNAKVTYHDPCRLGRYNDIYEQPRELIKSVNGVELVEPKRTKESSWCCGGGGGVLGLFPLLSMKISEDRFGQLDETKAEYILTCCSGCKANLDRAARKNKSEKKVMNLTEFLVENLEE